VALAHPHIGTVNQINYGPKFEQARDAFVLKEVGSLEQNFTKLALGRIDVAPCSLYTASYMLAQPEFQHYADQLTQLPDPIETVPSFIAFAKDRTLHALIAQFDIEFKKVKHSGLYRQWLKKYHIDLTPELHRYLRQR
jgi:polar amino acid transport system substrate-binding protein